jgi:class 3 adenylate cyclase
MEGWAMPSAVRLREDYSAAALRALARRSRNVKRTGDGSIFEFRSVVDAVRCAIEVQTSMIERNAGLPTYRRRIPHAH